MELGNIDQQCQGVSHEKDAWGASSEDCSMKANELAGDKATSERPK